MVKTPLYKIAVVFLFVLALSFVSGGKVHAASITVVGGLDDIATNGDCQLSEAIININDQAQTYPDCVAGDGINDTITLPPATITLSDNLPVVTQPVSIEGVGTNSSIIDGNIGQYFGLEFAADGDVVLSDFKIQAFRAFGLSAGNSGLVINNIEIDGLNAVEAPTSFSFGQFVIGGISYVLNSPVNRNLDVTGLYIHDLTLPTGIYVSGFRIDTGNGATANINVKNMTISEIHSESPNTPQVSGLAVGVNGAVVGENMFSNITINDITASSSTVASAVQITAGSVGLGTIASEVDFRNVTISRFEADANQNNADSAILVLGYGATNTDVANVNLNITNLLVLDSRVGGAPDSCQTLDATSGFGGTGLGYPTITSQGGNLSDDTTCSSFFTQPTDQNNLTNLSSTLGPLSDNGGYVPTIPLLQGSPAIDSGVTVAGLITDARQAVRPQGTAYDSGAYESPFTKPTTSLLASTGQSTLLLTIAGMCGIASSVVLIGVIKSRY
ncbi:hypothetical protein KBD20_02870 [Candidatus Saccharibacteria bacterium]|nr:hypothetical protein [Candidatus Saccharibacteria bacterium]